MSNLIAHAKFELDKAGLFDKDSDYNGMLGEAVLELITTFSKQGHSGFSAGLTTQLFSKLAKFEPLTALAFTEDEWVHVADEDNLPLYQNKRDSRYFKRGDGEPYNVEER